MAKQYGLIVPNKNKPLHPLGTIRPSIFGEDSDSDSGSAKPTGLKTALKRQDRLLQEKAVEEDPTVFQYDELYDDMEAKRKESKLSRKDLDKKPKYINKLLESASRRKRENERRITRQVEKEREAEGEEFKDKESFVTSSYRAKLEEMKKLEEEEKREEYLEAIGDVKRQGNLDGFYRHLYEQKVLYNEDKAVKVEDKEIKQEKNCEEENGSISKEMETAKSSQDEESKPSGSKEKPGAKKRKYRKRDESSDSEPETQPVESVRTLQHLPSNLDADSDFSIDSSDSEDESEVKKRKVAEAESNATTEDKEPLSEIKVEESEDKKGDEKEIKEDVEEKPCEVEKTPPKPKINIWKKRLVGEAFDEALRRYFERKSLREAGMYVRPEPVKSY